MEIHALITADPNICHGKPCFKGTRIMVSTVLDLLAAGEGHEEIIKAFPNLTVNHIKAALHVASELLNNEQIHPLHAA